MSGFIEGLPKVELHLHIEGTLEPELVFALAERNNVKLAYADQAALKDAYQFSDLQSFLDIYYQGSRVLLNEQDFFDMTWAYLTRAHAEQVRHTEIFFDPQAHTARGVPFAVVMSGIHRALEQARQEWGMTSRLIMSFLRHLSEQDAFDTLKDAMPFKDRIAGVGLDSSEQGNPPAKFGRVYAACQELGFRLVAHAGEEGPPQNICDALDILQVERIDHGVAAIRDPDLVARLAAEHVPLTVCPLSNLRLRVVEKMSDHPLLRLLQAGVKVTINSDDPAYFGGYMNANYQAVQQGLGASDSQLLAMTLNAVNACWLSPEEKAHLSRDILAYGQRYGVS
ncbi:adenosine deaminase [Zobellella maritima]|uniref:adenosine deaminase n=1 Tax=Zobellella maritima TaxID=2059725 RepID=UPI000E2FF7F8|nr:adenosine deaminase [Zobellella maritima]